MGDTTLIDTAVAVLGPAASNVAGGWSGETFAATDDGPVLRIYARRPDRAAVDAALMHRLAGLVPVPPLLDARPLSRHRSGPPWLLTDRLPGRRLDLVLGDDPDRATAERLGAAVADVAVKIGSIVFPRTGGFLDDRLEPVPWEPAVTDIHTCVRRLHAVRGWSDADVTAFAQVVEYEVEPLLESASATARLVHSDFNPKNLLVDEERCIVTGVLDWEYAHAGNPLTDAGNMLRFTSGAFADGFAARYGRVAPAAQAAGPAWIATARALDIFALVDLACREGTPAANPVTRAAEDLLRRTAAHGLAATRRTPGANRR